MSGPFIRSLLVPLLLLLSLPWVQGVLSSQLESTIRWGRSVLVNRSLKGFWKLPDSSNNFRINTKLTMINEQSDRKKRVSTMLNFLTAADTTREV
jgi:hypothetical protein